MAMKVMDKPCDQCLMTKNKIVSDDRRKEISEETNKKQAYFSCHKKEGVCCRGFFDSKYGENTRMIRILKRFNMVKFVSLGKIQDNL